MPSRGQPRRRGHLQLRRVVGSRRADLRWCARRRVRVGRPRQHVQAHRCRPRRRRTGGLRHQCRRDHRRARQPARHRGRGRPGRQRADRRAVCTRGAVRCLCRTGRRQRRHHRDAVVVRGEREGGRHQGDARRGRRRHRLSHRCDRRRRRRPGGADPRRHQRGRRVSDRHSSPAPRTPAGAQAFVDFVLSPSGQDILAAFGFGPA